MSKVTRESFVVAAPPASGETAPLLRIAEELVRSGHDVIALVGSRFEDQVPDGARFVPLRGLDIDERRVNEVFPERLGLAAGPDQLNFDLAAFHVDPMPERYAQLQELLDQDPGRRLIANSLYQGAWPVALGAPGRAPVRWVSVVCNLLFLSSDDTTPFGPLPPGAGDVVLEHRAANAAFAALLDPLQDRLRATVAELGATREPAPFLDGVVTYADRCAQLSVAGFEFHRGDAPDTLHHVGIVPLRSSDGWAPPAWWSELDDGRPVVVVTQGTLANHDLTELVAPALEGLAGEDVLVVAALGRHPSALAAPVPGNARVAEFIPFSALLPRADCFVTNGGFGATQAALAAGVPVVVAGDTDDKPLVAARVAARGVGIDLGTSRPSPGEVAQAVRAVLADEAVRRNVAELAKVYAGHDALAEILALALT